MDEERLEVDFELLDEIAFQHTTSLHRAVRQIDQEGEISIPYLNTILDASTVDSFDTLIAVFARIKKEHHRTTNPNMYPSVMDGLAIWGRMYVIAYYKLYDDEFWAKTVLPRMYEMQPNRILQDEMKICVAQIDKYYQDKHQWILKQVEAGAPSPDDFAIFVQNEQLRKQVEELQKVLKQKEDNNSPYGIAEKSKTDVMKVINYMFDLGMFCRRDGEPIKRQKKQFMIAVGNFFNSDFENYAQIINRAAQEERFLTVFNDLYERAKNKYLEEEK